MNVIFTKARLMMRAGTLVKYRQPARGAILLDVDWMPGPYPKTEKERIAAAKKYNLLPEEYEPLDPKWDVGMGDYPVLPNRCFDDEDPYSDYEHMADARHFGEPVHHAWEVLGGSGMNLNYPKNEPAYISGTNVLLITWCMLLFSFWYVEYIKHVPFITRAKPQHMPVNGVHYHYPTSNLHAYE